MIRWACLWLALIIGGSGLINWWLDMDLPTWQLQLRYFSAFFFLLSIFTGSVFTLSRKRFYQREWSFILILVTMGLFGISMY